MFVGDCCFSLCVKKGGMFEMKTLPLSLSFSTLSIQINHKVNEDRSQNRISNEYAREHTNTHVGNKLENKQTENLGNTPFFLNVSRGETPQFRGGRRKVPRDYDDPYWWVVGDEM